MKLNNTQTIALTGLIAAATLFHASSAKAVSLTGSLNVSSTLSNGGVIFEGFGIADINGNSLSNLDFVPPNDPGFPEPGGTGSVVIDAPSGSDFFTFVNQEGTINDLPPFPGTEPAFPGEELDPVIEGFINVPNAFRFDLSDSDFPTYNEVFIGDSVTTTVLIGLEGTFVNLADGSNNTSSGSGTLRVDFVGFTTEEIQTLYNERGEAFGPLNWTANFVATAEKPLEVPDASSNNVLTVFALASSALIAYWRKKA